MAAPPTAAAAAAAAPPPPAFAIIAHRGDSDTAPENTLAAFDLALSRGFAAFETDAQLSADGAPVLLHCEALGRTTDGAGPVAVRSLAELKALDAGTWFSPDHAGARALVWGFGGAAGGWRAPGRQRPAPRAAQRALGGR
jgi:glycerophosphoryl diester phosphodiesterase